MFSTFSINNLNQKELYFALNSAMSLAYSKEIRNKPAGIYVIYRDDLCLYVGQSCNLPSRIATHLYGKYKNATRVDVYTVEDSGFSDFRDRGKDSQSDILLNNEAAMIRHLTPLDNIISDLDADIPENELCFNITKSEADND